MQLLANSIVAASYYFLAALSVALVIQVNGFIKFTLGIICACSAYLFFWSQKFLFLHIGLGLCLTLVGILLLAFILHKCIFNPLASRGASSSILMIASLGVYIVLENIISIIFGDTTQTLAIPFSNAPVTVLNATITLVQLYLLISTILFSVSLYLLLYFTQIGKQLRAVIDNHRLAFTLGFDLNFIRLFSIIIASIGFAIVGIFHSLDIGIVPNMGMHLFLMGTVASFIGGNTLFGTFTGALFLSFLQQSSLVLFPARWQDSITFLVIFMCLLFIPKKIFKTEPMQSK